MRTTLLVLIIGAAVMAAASGRVTAGQAPDPETVIAKSISYHDPTGVWISGRVEMELLTTYSDDLAARAGGKTAKVQLLLAPAEERFRYVKTVGKDVVEYRVSPGDTAVVVNGSETITDADRERLRLRDPLMYRDYFEYLFGMPMKLRDPGAIIEPQVTGTTFNGTEVWALRVTYSPEVGTDTWYFYFHRETFALHGYRFYKDESKNDGEYITFEGEVAHESMRLPRTRAWYYNEDDGYLATDEIVSMKGSVSSK